MNRFVLRLKILLKDRTADICFIICTGVMLCLLIGLKSVSEERSAVPIGLVVEDDSPEALELAENIKKTVSVYVSEGTREELEERLLDGYLNCIFIIDKGYGERIRNAETEDLVTIISGDDDRMSVIIGDIIAGHMLYDVCLNKGFRLYSSLPKEDKLDWYEYRNYVLQLKEDPTFAFTFNVTYEDPIENKKKEEEV